MEAHSIWQKLLLKLSVFLNFGRTHLTSYCFDIRVTPRRLCACLCVRWCACRCGASHSCFHSSVLKIIFISGVVLLLGNTAAGRLTWSLSTPLSGEDGQAITARWLSAVTGELEYCQIPQERPGKSSWRRRCPHWDLKESRVSQAVGEVVRDRVQLAEEESDWSRGLEEVGTRISKRPS